MASTFMASALQPLMSAKMSPALGGSPHKAEAIAASNTDHRPTRWVVHRRKLRTVKITPSEASVFLAKTLQPLTPAKMSPALGGSPHKPEVISASNTNHRPTRWVVVRGELKTPKLTHGYANDLLVEINCSGLNAGAASP